VLAARRGRTFPVLLDGYAQHRGGRRALRCDRHALDHCLVAHPLGRARPHAIAAGDRPAAGCSTWTCGWAKLGRGAGGADPESGRRCHNGMATFAQAGVSSNKA